MTDLDTAGPSCHPLSVVKPVRSSGLSDVAGYAYPSKINISDAELIFTAGARPTLG
jgi:hypothetical protein